MLLQTLITICFLFSQSIVYKSTRVMILFLYYMPSTKKSIYPAGTQSLNLWTNKWIDKWTPLAQRAQNIDINCVSRRPSTCHFLTAAKIEINLFQYSGLITHRKWKLSVIKVTSPQRSNVGSSKLFALYISIPGSGWSPGGGHGNQLQYSCLENSMDRGAWWARVHGITKSWRWLKWLSMHIHIQNTSLSKCSTQSYMLFSLLTMELEHISTIYLTNPLLMM